MNILRFILLTSIVSLTFGCKSGTTNQSSLDLMQHGLPISINAPADSKVKLTDFGFAKDVTIIGGDDYNIQILSSKALSTDVGSIKKDKIEEAKGSLYFSKIVEEFDNGFIFEKKISDTKLKYDFRSIKIQGDQEYVFQSGLTGDFNLEQIKNMYNSVQ